MNAGEPFSWTRFEYIKGGKKGGWVEGIVDEESSDAGRICVWTAEDMLPVSAARSEVRILEAKEMMPEYVDEAIVRDKSVGGLGAHVRLELIGAQRKRSKQALEGILQYQMDAVGKTAQDIEGVTFQSSPIWDAEDQCFIVKVTLSNVKTSVESIILKLSDMQASFAATGEHTVNTFLCDKLSRYENHWKAVGDRALLHPIRHSSNWVPLMIACPEGCSAVGENGLGYTPECLGRRLAYSALMASKSHEEAKGFLVGLPGYARHLAFSQMKRASEDIARHGVTMKDDMAPFDTSHFAALHNIPLQPSKITDEQSLQIQRACARRVFLQENDTKLRVLFRVASFHGYVPRKLGKYESNKRYRGYGKRIRVLKDEQDGEQKMAPQSLVRMVWDGVEERWEGINRPRARLKREEKNFESP